MSALIDVCDPWSEELPLELVVRDPEVIAELGAIRDPAERERAALLALRVGVLALRGARGEVDVDRVRREGDRLVGEMRALLAGAGAVRAVQDRSAVRGLRFEQALLQALATEAARWGDVCQHVGRTTGLIRHCKVGDAVVTLGPECVGAGRRAVFEAKEEARLDERRALEELELARRNRGAEVGVLVLSRATSDPPRPLRRFGQDLVVVWDAADPESDVYLHAAYSVARALLTRPLVAPAAAAELEAIERAALEIEKQAGHLDAVQRSGETIRRGAERILSQTHTMQGALRRQVEALRAQLQSLRSGGVHGP